MRVSVTNVEAYRRWKQDETPLEDLLAFLRREKPPTEPMLAGRALHKALETAPDGVWMDIGADGYRFSFAQDIELQLPQTRELKIEVPLLINGTPVTLVGVVDTLYGNRVEDHKTTSRFDAERFVDSCQWKMYLWMCHAKVFRWNVFEIRETGDREYLVYGFHMLEQSAYPGMEADCRNLLADFVEFASVYLPERQAAA